MSDNKRNLVYLAALLHDIGKFYQRADYPLNDERNTLSKETLKIADYLCPLNPNGNFGYQHTVWTFQFICSKETIFRKIPGVLDSMFEVERPDSLFQLASYHHRPSDENQALVSLADWWSAGIDRRSQSSFEVEDGMAYHIDWGKERYKRIPLYSVFNKILGGNYSNAFGLRPLSIDEDGFFPKKIDSKSDGISQDKYAELWKKFNEEFDNLPTDTFEAFTESLFFLLKKYTWCIPSNTTDMANVSLFDHLKTTAAFADCLYAYKENHNEDFLFSDNRLSLKDGAKPVLLLGGDLSGIQKFIYNIASRKAAVSLKGRSFYLQLLIDSIIQKIISHSDIKATIAHVVYSSGGKFYMLLPNTGKVRTAVNDLKTEIESFLWKEHNGQLIVNLDYIPFAYNIQGNGIDFEDCQNKPIGELWRALADKLSVQKNQKFHSVIVNEYDKLFTAQDVAKESKVCAVTGIESKECVLIDDKQKDSAYVLPVVKQQAMLGTTLKDADYILTHKSKEANTYLQTRAKCDIDCAGIHNYLFDQKELTDDNADFRRITSADVCRVRMINNVNFLAPQLKGKGCSYGFQFYGGNKQAQIRNCETCLSRDKTYEELADNTYLGVLRMDVDNLGSIFIKGLPDEDKSFAAYSTLSFMLDYFFSGFLNTIRNGVKYKSDVNILYSGGDDIFAVGRWDRLIEFAEDVRKKFGEFVGRNDISISGGITTVGDKFPIAKAAELAGDAEDFAKHYNNSAKNAFCMFNECVSWSDEFEYVKRYKEQFVNLIKNYSLSKGLLHRIMSYAGIVKENMIIAKENEEGNNKRKTDMSYLWHTAYYLTRYRERYMNNNVVRVFCEDLRDKQLIKTDNYRLMSLAARWAELELREVN